MSLVSYEDTDTDNDKYYNEEELTNIMGLDQIDINKKKKQGSEGNILYQ